MGNCNQITNKTKEKFDETLFKHDIPIKTDLPKFYRFLRPIYFQSKHLTALKGETTNSKKPVVIKKISKSDENRLAFKGEIFALLSLDHPNISKLLEFFQTKVHYYIIYPYFDGLPLVDYCIKNPKDTNEFFLRKVIEEVLSALAYMHERNICHRNISTKKLIFDGKTVLLTGLNYALPYKKKTLFKDSHVENEFKSPEAIEGKGYNQKADVWSMGIVFHIIITGTHPFEGQTLLDMEQNIINQPFSLEKLKKTKISEEAIDVITKMLEKDTNKRFEAKELLKMAWFTSKKEKVSELHVVRTSIQEFQKRNKLLDQFKKFYVQQVLNIDEKAEIAQAFKDFDVDNNGVLTYDEFKLAINSTFFCMNEDEVLALFREMDTNKNGVIEFSEFMVGLMGRNESLNKERIHHLFELVDTDQSGYVTIEEFRKLMGKDKQLDQYFSKFANKDKKLDKKEFTELIFNISQNEKQK
jgi:calcium-dependent protein kinase